VLLRLRGRTRAAACWTLLGAAMVFAITWGPFAWRQRLNVAGNNWWILDTAPPGGHAARMLWWAALMPMRFLAEPLRRAEPVACVLGVLYVIPPLLLWLRGRRDLLIWWLWLLSTVGMVLITDLVRGTRQLEFLRYTIVAAPAVYALLAALFAPLLADRRQRWLAHVVPAAALVTCICALPSAYEETQTPKPDWRVPAALMAREATPRDAVIFRAASEQDSGYAGSHYLALRYYLGERFPRTVVFTSRRPDEATLNRLRETADNVWIVVPTDVGIPVGFLPGFRPADSARVFGLPLVQRWTTSR
jgi:hypothetical protein